jgi:hypothetical protein
MDITQFTTKDKANEGVWVPITLYGKEADFDLLILGDDSDAVQKYERAASKKLASLFTKAMNDKNQVDDVEDYDDAVIVRINGIRGWNVKRKDGKEEEREVEPVVLCGKILVSEPESYRFLIKKIPAIKDIVLKYARDRNNFLSQPSGN